MSKKLVLLTIFYFGSLIPYGISLPQNCPCSKSQYSYSGPPQLVLARPWSGYNANSPTYLPFPLVISRGTRAIKSALESPEEANKKLKTDLVDLEDKNSKAQINIKPKAATSPRRRIKTTSIDDRRSNSEEKLAVKNKPETEETLREEIDEEEEEEEESSDDQREIATLNLLGQLFQVLALQYQKVFGEQNNLSGTNSTSVLSKSDVDDEEQEDYGDYSYDSVPTQIDSPETEQKIVKKEKRKAEIQIEEKDKVQRINFNSTTMAKPLD